MKVYRITISVLRSSWWRTRKYSFTQLIEATDALDAKKVSDQVVKNLNDSFQGKAVIKLSDIEVIE